jgi:transcriptional regulator with XRE-family HTH domain
MAKKTAPLLPATEALLSQLGERLRMARLRRKLTAKQVAERAGMAPMTLRSLERGGAGVTMGAYLAVMQVLGLEQDLGAIAHTDPMGRELQDARLNRSARRAHTAVDRPVPRNTSAPVDTPRPASPSVGRVAEPSPPDWVTEGGFADAKALADLLLPPARQR